MLQVHGRSELILGLGCVGLLQGLNTKSLFLHIITLLHIQFEKNKSGKKNRIFTHFPPNNNGVRQQSTKTVENKKLKVRSVGTRYLFESSIAPHLVCFLPYKKFISSS